MKSEAPFHYNNSPLKIVEHTIPSVKPPLRVIEKNDFTNKRFSFIKNKAIEDCSNWDASWFANYE